VLPVGQSLEHWWTLRVSARYGSPGRVEDITVASSNREIRLIGANCYLTPLTRLPGILWVVPDAVLTPQFFSNIGKCRRHILQGIGLVVTTASVVC
jgi:hypothetical protein